MNDSFYISDISFASSINSIGTVLGSLGFGHRNEKLCLLLGCFFTLESVFLQALSYYLCMYFSLFRISFEISNWEIMKLDFSGGIL